MPLIITGHFIWALVIGIIASLCDALDGAVARAGAGPTKAGAFLDSTLDRVSELMVAAALVVYFVREGPQWGPVVAVLVFMGSAQMVSYIRARAEALGRGLQGRLHVPAGAPGRPRRRVPVLVVAAGRHELPRVVAVPPRRCSPSITVVHRELHVLRKLRARGAAAGAREPRRPAAAATTSATSCGPSPRARRPQVLSAAAAAGPERRRRVIYSRALSRAGRAPSARPDPAPIDAAARGGRSQWR